MRRKRTSFGWQDEKLYCPQRSSDISTALRVRCSQRVTWNCTSAIESGRTTDPSLLDAYRILGRLRHEIEQLPDQVSGELFARV